MICDNESVQVTKDASQRLTTNEEFPTLQHASKSSLMLWCPGQHYMHLLEQANMPLREDAEAQKGHRWPGFNPIRLVSTMTLYFHGNGTRIIFIDWTSTPKRNIQQHNNGTIECRIGWEPTKREVIFRTFETRRKLLHYIRNQKEAVTRHYKSPLWIPSEKFPPGTASSSQV